MYRRLRNIGIVVLLLAASLASANRPSPKEAEVRAALEHYL